VVEYEELHAVKTYFNSYIDAKTISGKMVCEAAILKYEVLRERS